MVNRKGLGQANILRTNNNTSTGYGVAYADEVSGHRTVGSLADLYALHDWQLSASGDNTNSDAIGQLWYVVNADGNGNGCYYQLKDWSKRKEAAGWSIADYTTKAELQDKIDNIATADEEDITTEGDTPQTQVLKLKDRAYDSLNASGKGYKILRKNWQQINGERKNVLTQAMINEPNTIYEIRYDFDLNGESVDVPSNSILRFNGGTIVNGGLIFKDTFIESPFAYGIIGCELSGTIKNHLVYPEWLVANKDSDFKDAIQTLINIKGDSLTIAFTKSQYVVSPTIILKGGLVLKSICKSRILVNTSELYVQLFNSHASIENVTFDGLHFDQLSNDTYTTLRNDQVARLFIGIYGQAKNIKIINCIFDFNGTNAVSLNGEIENSVVSGNIFHFERAHIADDRKYDVSAVYVTDHYHVIENNRIYSSEGEFNRFGGGIETHGVNGIVSNNMISGVSTCINVVNNIVPSSVDVNGRTIIGNTCDDCFTFINFWSSESYGVLKNVLIEGNQVTNIHKCAIKSQYSPSEKVTGDIENITITGNSFSGIRYTFDGSDLNDNMLAVSERGAINLFCIGGVKNFLVKNNVFSNFPCHIISTGYHQTNITKTQEVEFIDNIIDNCFNCAVTYDYPQYQLFGLFYVSKNSKLTIERNIIKIPTSIKIPPVIVSAWYNANISLKNNIYPVVQSVLIKKGTDSIIYNDAVPNERKPLSYMEIGKDYHVVGDIINDRGVTSRCSSPGRDVDVVLSNAKAITFHNFGYLKSDNIEELIIGDVLETSYGTTNGIETIGAIVVDKIYTHRWINLRAFIGNNTEVDATLNLQKCVFVDSSVAMGAVPTNSKIPVGGMYYSKGFKRPCWKDNSDIWRDSFGNLAQYSNRGTFASIPSASDAGSGFMYYDTTNKRMLLSNGTSWVNMDGTPLA